MSDPPPLPEGTVIAGKLRVVRLLGMGGMGSVYEVEHEFTKHRRALKMLHAEMLEHPVVVARFIREASAAGASANPHIVETFDAGKLDGGGEPYIVMEMLQGETLADRLEKQRRLGLPELVDVMRQASDGVQAAHDAGIVHRDLKPENLFLVEKDGKPFVKILDFGVSKFDPTLTGGADGTTKEGSALGTPYYMSPEQVDGEKDLDARTDVYALGVILYQCASGKRPFKADALPKLAVLIHEGKPMPLSERRPELPVGFSEVVHRAMARDRTLRFTDAARASVLRSSRSARWPSTRRCWSRATSAEARRSRPLRRPSRNRSRPRPNRRRTRSDRGSRWGARRCRSRRRRPHRVPGRRRPGEGTLPSSASGSRWSERRRSSSSAAAPRRRSTRDPSRRPRRSPRWSPPEPAVVLRRRAPSSGRADAAHPDHRAARAERDDDGEGRGRGRHRPRSRAASGASSRPPSASTAPKTGTTRVEQKGLAGENPF